MNAPLNPLFGKKLEICRVRFPFQEMQPKDLAAYPLERFPRLLIRFSVEKLFSIVHFLLFKLQSQKIYPLEFPGYM